MEIRKTGPNGSKAYTFQIGTIIITLGLSHHRTSLSPLFRTFILSYVWVTMFNQFCTHIFSIRIIQYWLNINLIQWCNCGQSVQMWVSPICRVSLGSESRIYEFPSGKFRLQEVGSRNYEWETGASRQHPEFPS